MVQSPQTVDAEPWMAGTSPAKTRFLRRYILRLYPSNPNDGPGVASFGSTDSAGLSADVSNAANIR